MCSDLIIKLEIPAVDIEKDIDISVDQGMLRLSGKRSSPRRAGIRPEREKR
jgi:HSP20 family molecular chaperone IbpA